MKYEGGCACGVLRYGCELDPGEAGYCHCRLCQKTTAAPVSAFASFPVEGFVYLRGEPAIYQSSPHGHREFCHHCGTQIAYRDSEAATTVDVNAGSLDNPSVFVPQFHIWCQSQLPFFKIDDGLPRYDRGYKQD